MAKKKVPSKILNWRKAVPKAMYKATQKEARDRFGSATPLFNYRWEHVQTVVKLALRLAELAGADPEIVEAAAWLHDIEKDKGTAHPQKGADFAREFLPKTDFPAEKIEPVAQTIEDHTGLWRKTPLDKLESMVLWDADKLAKLGLTAAFHWLGMGFATGRASTTAELIARGRTADWQEKTVASMHTAPARQAAQTRLSIYRQLWDTLEMELNASDLKGNDEL